MSQRLWFEYRTGKRYVERFICLNSTEIEIFNYDHISQLVILGRAKYNFEPEIYGIDELSIEVAHE